MSTQLSEKIDDQEQYSRRLYLVFEGLNSVDDDNKNLSQEIVNIVRNELNVKISGDDIDKSHPIKEIKENRYIVKFTKHSMAETIYKHRKKLIKKKEDKTNQLIKITLLHLREPIKNQVVFSLISKMELAEILGLIEHFEYHTKFGEADNESNCKV